MRGQDKKLIKEIHKDLNGFLSVLKPSGVTSMQVVEYFKSFLGRKFKVGHCGTLDSLASGTLPLAFGRATKFIPFLDDTKEYVIEVLFGIRTDTDDMDGKIIAKAEPKLTEDDLREVLRQFTGEIDQVPPKYSAKKVYGYRAYQLARSGYDVEIEPKKVRIDSIQLLKFYQDRFPRAILYVRCSRGTYMRALARDIGEALKIPSTLSFITRTSAFGFRMENSILLEDLEKLSLSEKVKFILERLSPPSEVLSHLSTVILRDDAIFKVKNGSNFSKHNTVTIFDNNNRYYKVTDKSGNLIAIAYSEDGRYFKLKRVY